MCDKIKVQELDPETQENNRCKDTMCDKVKVLELEPTNQKIFNDCFKGRVFARFGDAGYLLNACYKKDVDTFRNLAVRPDDVWVTSFPRSGTTWTQELVWLIMNNLDFSAALKIPLSSRYITMEQKLLIYKNEDNQDVFDSMHQKMSKVTSSYDEIVKTPSPRFFKSHLPFSLLPSTLLDTCKVVFVARDPRDVAVSFYHFLKLIWDSPGDFKSFWNLFIKDLVPRAPYLKHLKEAWALRNHPNMLFIFYEDMKKDLPSSIKRISDFLGKKVTNEQIKQLCEHLDIENFRRNKSVNPTWISTLGNPDGQGFVRVGKSGGWREHFDEEMAAQAQRWLREGLAGSGLRFPHDSSLVFD